jgi:hypothetical protein
VQSVLYLGSSGALSCNAAVLPTRVHARQPQLGLSARNGPEARIRSRAGAYSTVLMPTSLADRPTNIEARDAVHAVCPVHVRTLSAETVVVGRDFSRSAITLNQSQRM